MSTSQICPFLGLREDPETWLAYPSVWNYCHKCKPVSAMSNDQQESCCLGGYLSCPVYNRAERRRVPSGLRARSSLTGKQRRLILSGVVLLVVIGLAAFVGFTRPVWLAGILGMDPASQAAAAPAPTLDQVAAAAEQQTKPTITAQIREIIATATRAVTPARAKATSTREAAGASDSRQDPYQIHKVAKGETLETLADQYGSSVEAITAVNYFLPEPLWEGWLMVIPTGITDPTGLTSFEVYLVAVETTVDDLALKLGADRQSLVKFNELEPSARVPAGTWLLVPKS